MANTSTWKSDEAAIAAKLTEVLRTEERYGHTIKRIPLSGSNNRRTDGTKHRGDVSLPDEIDALIECKRRKSAAHQTFLDAAKADAAKHGITPENTILIFKVLRQRGFTAIIDADLLWRLLALPGAAELLTRDKPLEPRQVSASRPLRRAKPPAEETLATSRGRQREKAGAVSPQDDG